MGNSKIESSKKVAEVRAILDLIGTVNVSILMEKVLAIQAKPEAVRKLYK